MGTQFIRMEFAPSRVCVIVKLNFSMTLETHRNGIVNGIGSAITTGVDVVQLDLYTAVAMTNAATAVARH